ncbi:MAG: SDR family oxidoreductase [Thermoplasmata archaeon]|nr:SDR family oxidoreductase [Thermoplasmata archaeon]MBE3140856.1 SDR family oxidoreductase [Thermoplasmata archaeon]
MKMELFDLKNKVALVFGGNGYLGKEFCKALLENNATVYCCDSNTDESKEITMLKKNYSEKFEMMNVNATDKNDLLQLKEKILEKEKTIDILINSTSAKSDDFYLPFEDVSLESWNVGLLGNLTIPFLTIQTFIPIMKKQRKGSIINISSVYGIVGNDQRMYVGTNLHEIYVKKSPDLERIYSHGSYNAAKGGLINFTRYLAAYYGGYNIRINCISPGGIYHEKEDKIFLKNYSERTPLGRKANLDEINGSIIFLASDASSYVTGHNLVVDGGFTIW